MNEPTRSRSGPSSLAAQPPALVIVAASVVAAVVGFSAAFHRARLSDAERELTTAVRFLRGSGEGSARRVVRRLESAAFVELGLDAAFSRGRRAALGSPDLPNVRFGEVELTYSYDLPDRLFLETWQTASIGELRRLCRRTAERGSIPLPTVDSMEVYAAERYRSQPSLLRRLEVVDRVEIGEQADGMTIVLHADGVDDRANLPGRGRTSSFLRGGSGRMVAALRAKELVEDAAAGPTLLPRTRARLDDEGLTIEEAADTVTKELGARAYFVLGYEVPHVLVFFGYALGVCVALLLLSTRSVMGLVQPSFAGSAKIADDLRERYLGSVRRVYFVTLVLVPGVGAAGLVAPIVVGGYPLLWVLIALSLAMALIWQGLMTFVRLYRDADTFAEMVTRRQKNCFVSYSREEEDFVTRLCAALERRGLTAWHDVVDVKSGARLSQEVRQGILVSESLLLVVSKGALASEWVKLELREAWELGRGRGDGRIVPLFVEERSILDGSKILHHDVDLAQELAGIAGVDFHEALDGDAFEERVGQLCGVLGVEGLTASAPGTD